MLSYVRIDGKYCLHIAAHYRRGMIGHEDKDAQHMGLGHRGQYGWT